MTYCNKYMLHNALIYIFKLFYFNTYMSFLAVLLIGRHLRTFSHSLTRYASFRIIFYYCFNFYPLFSDGTESLCMFNDNICRLFFLHYNSKSLYICWCVFITKPTMPLYQTYFLILPTGGNESCRLV